MSLCALAPLSPIYAQMAKLVDALVSGTSVSDDVQVRVLFWAQNKTKDKRIKTKDTFIFYLEQAQMAKLVDALVSGTSVSNDVQVRVLFWAL